MGYTNYWKFNTKANESDYVAAKKVIRRFIKYAISKGFNLANGTGDDNIKPCLSQTIHFNGIDDDSHESVYLYATLKDMWQSEFNANGFQFCKTARKSYDPVVIGTLLILKDIMGKGVTISSDGINCDPEYNYYITSILIEGIKLYCDFWESEKNETVDKSSCIKHAITQFVDNKLFNMSDFLKSQHTQGKLVDVT